MAKYVVMYRVSETSALLNVHSPHETFKKEILNKKNAYTYSILSILNDTSGIPRCQIHCLNAHLNKPSYFLKFFSNLLDLKTDNSQELN